MELSGKPRRRPLSKANIVLALYAAASVLGIGIAFLRNDRNLYFTDRETSLLHLVIGPAVGIAIGLAFVAFTRIANKRFAWALALHQEFKSLLGELSRKEIFTLAIASSFGEELLFRGALQPWLGLLPQAILFAALHVGPDRRFLPWTFLAFVFGLIFGWLFSWSGNLGGPILAHFTINFLNLLYIVGPTRR